jgi:subfamily B ATP-binding cassette protein HlyB/CyaB
MSVEPFPTSNPPQNSGLNCFVLVLRILGVAVDPAQLAHRYGPQFGVSEMLRCAKDLKIKARAVESDWHRLTKTALPAIALRHDSSFFIIAKATEAGVLFHDTLSGKAQSLSRDELATVWTGHLILMTRRAGLADLARRFDITWFLQAMHKYRRLLVEVLLASFFLQLFALISPLFFQVVIDKVLVHRGLSTLNILLIGLVIVAVFESLLTALRTYVFSHTTNRIDIELGARLFKHLVALPIGYFEARRAGDSVARVRELENIRSFLKLGFDARHRPVLYLRLSRRHGVLFAVPHRRRHSFVPVLHRHLGDGDAGLPPPSR